MVRICDLSAKHYITNSIPRYDKLDREMNDPVFRSAAGKIYSEIKVTFMGLLR